MRVNVWGLGKMGLPLACVFAQAGFAVTGIDTNEGRVKAVNEKENPFQEEPGLSDLLNSVNLTATATPVEADIHVIIIPIVLSDRKADFSILESVCKRIARVLRKGDIVVLESTAPPGTCENVVVPLLEESGLQVKKDFGVAHCPERTMAGTALDDIRGKYPKIIGASDPKTGEILSSVYSRINKKGIILMKNTKTAEAVKVFEGIYRDVNIALANELALYCEEANIDVTKVISAANTQPYCHLHNPGAGVGGHCIPVYPYFIMSEKTKVIKAARETNEFMPHHVVDLTEKMLRERGKSMEKAKIVLLGIAFRRGVKEERFSPFFPVRDELMRRGARVYGYDPLYTKEEAEQLDVEYCEDLKADAVIILTDHPEFVDIDWESLTQKVDVVVDGRNILVRDKMEALGFSYTGIGR